jgi:hypothetical protein
MNYFKEFINDLLTEVSYRTEEGIVDLKKSEHLTILSEVLDELGLSEIKGELFSNLFEADTKNPEDEKYKNTGGSGYVKASDYERWRNNPKGFDGLRFRKTDSGDYVQVDKDDNDVEKDVDTSQDGFWDYLKGDKSETDDESEVEIEDGVDRDGFDKKSKKQRDAPNGPNAQQILDDLNEGNLDKLTEYQNEVEKNRAAGIAGAGGGPASEGESKYCNACNKDKKQWRTDNEAEIQSVKEDLRGKKRTADEVRTAEALGLDPKSPEFLDILAEAELFYRQKLAEVQSDEKSILYLKPPKGFGGGQSGEDAYRDWMLAAYFGSIATKKRLEESKLDTSQPYKVVQSTTELDNSVQAHLEDMYKNAKTPEEKAHYKKQLKLFKKFRTYHDTYAIGKDENGRTTIVSISNKKDSQVRDPQNNTTPAQRLRFIQGLFGEEISKKVADTLNDGVEKVSNAQAATIRSQTKMVIDDDIIRVCEEERMQPYMEELNTKATDGKHRFSKFIMAKGKDWNSLSTKEKLELMQEYANSRLHDESGNSRIISKSYENEDGEVVDGTFYIDDDGKEVGPIKSLGASQIGLPFKPFGKISVKLGEFGANEESKNIKKTEKDLVKEVHTEVTQTLFEADSEEGGYHPEHRPDADNGKHAQGYILGTMKAMHIDAYIDMDDDDDGAILIQMGANGVKPSMIRECVAEKSGFTGDTTTPEGKKALKEFVLKRCRVTPGEEKISVMNGNKQVELFTDQWRTAGTGQKVASYFGNDMRECLQEKAKLNS